MNIHIRIRKHLLVLTLVLFGTSVNGALLNLSDTPLFLGANVKPNVFFQVDDSGSMDWSVLTPLYWHPCAFDPDATGSFSSTSCGYEVTTGLLRVQANGSWRDITYVYNNSDNDYSDSCSSSSFNSIETCSAIDADWRAASSSLNRIYYNPDSTHAPWDGPCIGSTACTDASFSSARSNPRSGVNGYSNTRDLSGFRYEVWIDDKGYTGSRPERGSNINYNTTPNGEIDLWDSHVRVDINSANAQVYSVSYAPDSSGMNETQTLQSTLSDSNACYNALGTSTLVTSIFNGSLSYNSTGATGCRTIAESQQNVANWYTYERRRSYITKSAIASVITNSPHFRYGASVINYSNDLFTEFPDVSVEDLTTHNLQIKQDLFNYEWQPAGTPLRTGLENVGKYYDDTLSGKSDPITHSCQQNFAILFTDGFWNGSNPSSGIGDSDGDGISRTVADVADYYYKRDLSPLTNNVPVNAFDTATHQHMVTYTVAFGVSGSLEDSDGDGWPNPALAENDDWGNPYYSDADKINDLWHAAFNSKGTYLAAQTPAALSDDLNSALANIAQRVSSAAAVAQNSTTLQTNSRVYQARFDSADWHGDLLSYSINGQGDISELPLWNASCRLTGGTCVLPAGTSTAVVPDERVIITRNWAAGADGIPFRFPNDYTTLLTAGSLPANLEAFMVNAPYAVSTTDPSEISANQQYGEDLLNYLRGSRLKEDQYSTASITFRDRSSVLGDIVHSDPIYVGAPSRYYSATFEESSYPLFKEAYASRAALVYTAANDGMLHGFDADTGDELLAYIPGSRDVYSALPRLSETPFVHEYLVDGSPNSADVFINNEWRTILVGGLRRGGQGIYALDITDPSTFSEENAEDILLFEMTDEDDVDLGYTFSDIQIAKVRTSSSSSAWALIFGSGYNNSYDDGFASTDGKAALFIVFIEDALDGINASDFIKLPVTGGSVTTPNGLSTPYPIDINGDFITDYVYAGDLNGRMWRFDLTGSDPSSWADQTIKLFHTASNQPITASPIVGAHPTGLANGVLVYFGTGQYLEIDDNDSVNQPTQSFYSIWDRFSTDTVLITNLLSQDIVDEEIQTFDVDNDSQADKTVNARLTTDNPIDWDVHDGWKLDLTLDGDNHGERQVTRPLLRNNAIIFTTLVPSLSTCKFGGDSWIMELDAESGSSLGTSPFDFNENQQFDDGDNITFYYNNTSTSAAASGYQSEVGITATPAVFISTNKLFEVKVISGSSGLGSFAEGPVNAVVGRQTWRQLK